MAEFIVVSKGPCVASRIMRMLQFSMRTHLANERPSILEECSVYDPSFGAGPLAHAICRSKLIELGGS